MVLDCIPAVGAFGDHFRRPSDLDVGVPEHETVGEQGAAVLAAVAAVAEALCNRVSVRFWLLEMEEGGCVG